ncbi:MAG TPA: Holliday junction branch migration protein RuvA [Candidatus Paceibacterota bacterium]|jgi:Holliday junction DNA helicase RuvA|nr:Holliday junction branch migration protein RuvA [Candidatus Paceibacterota bacterium]HRS47882.1 Holliday junction branch migration protein RuvA [Candidatus Paceibacterota bacterium]
MFFYLVATVKDKKENSLIVDKNGFGFEIFVSKTNLGTIKINSKIKLFIISKLNQDGFNEFYGFKTEKEKRVFELLISVDKIGPKTALNILSSSGLDKIISAIKFEKSEFLSQLTGLSIKTSQKIVIELSKKIKQLDKSSKIINDESDLEETLISLGFKKQDVRKTLDKLTFKKNASFQDKIKLALKALYAKI